MNNDLNLHFQLVNAFFIHLNFERPPTLPDPDQLPLTVEVKVIMENYPNRLQVNMRLKSSKESPVKFSTEVVGLFDYVGDDPEEGRAEIKDFIHYRGLHMLWSSISQMVQIVTSQMGMNPLRPNAPLEFNLDNLEFTSSSFAVLT